MLFLKEIRNRYGDIGSVAEPPLLWMTPAPDGQCPGADSDLLGSAPGKKRQLQAAPADKKIGSGSATLNIGMVVTSSELAA